MTLRRPRRSATSSWSRGGFIRQLSAGHYSMLPLGQRVRAKIDRILREEMDAIGGQQFHLPALHPAEIWRKSGRWETMGEELFRFKDRKGSDNALGMTHEEVFAILASEICVISRPPTNLVSDPDQVP